MEINISKIVLKEGGLKGCDVTYTQIEQKDGRSQMAEYTAKKKHPIQLSLERPFKDLRYHLLEICDQVNDDTDKKEKDQKILETNVISIEFGATWFQIKGDKDRFCGNKKLSLDTKVVEEIDEYENHESVSALIETIIEECKMYLRNEAKVTDDELVVRYVAAGKKEGFNEESFKQLPEADQKRIAAEIIESFGGAVMLADELEEVPEGEEIESEFSVSEIEEQPVEHDDEVQSSEENCSETEIPLINQSEEIILPRM